MLLEITTFYVLANFKHKIIYPKIFTKRKSAEKYNKRFDNSFEITELLKMPDNENFPSIPTKQTEFMSKTNNILTTKWTKRYYSDIIHDRYYIAIDAEALGLKSFIQINGHLRLFPISEAEKVLKLILITPDLLNQITALLKAVETVSTGYPPVDAELHKWKTETKNLLNQLL